MPDGTAATIAARRGGGEQLGHAARRWLEPALGVEVGGVRVHTDGPADALARSLRARAFTVGGDVFFAAGQYRPGSPAGDMLIAHESVHAVQQSGVDPGGRLVVSDPSDAHEREASSLAREVVTFRAPPSGPGRAGPTHRAARPRAPARPSVVHRDETGPPAGSIAANVPAGAQLQDIHVRIELPPKSVIKDVGWGTNMQTDEFSPGIYAQLFGSRVLFTFSGVFVEGPLVARCDVQTVNLDLSSGSAWTTARTTGAVGFDERKDVEARVSQSLKDMVAGSPIGTKFGYNLFTDPDPKGTLDKIAAALKTNLAKGPSGPLKAENVRITDVGASLKITEDIVRSAGTGSVEIPAGTTLGVDSNPRATAAAPPGPSSFGSVTITPSPGITVKKDGAGVARLTAIQVAGGVVKITGLELLGAAKAAAETEKGALGLLDLSLRLAQGLPPALAMQKVVLDNPNAVIVPGITRGIIESALQSALTAWIAKNGTHPGGVDLTGILGPSPANAGTGK